MASYLTLICHANVVLNRFRTLSHVDSYSSSQRQLFCPLVSLFHSLFSLSLPFLSLAVTWKDGEAAIRTQVTQSCMCMCLFYEFVSLSRLSLSLSYRFAVVLFVASSCFFSFFFSRSFFFFLSLFFSFVSNLFI